MCTLTVSGDETLGVAQSESDQGAQPVRWYRAGEAAALFAGGASCGVRIDRHELALFDVDGTVYALDDICTHGHARLSEGEFEGHEVECPLHAGLFDVRNGRAMCAPLSRDARCHAVKVEDGVVYVNTEALQEKA
ncbi:non-heme iron oxygenase ferredoxin subunit [Paraburkholderia sp. MMS20-SJTR3]|uniref:Non-heme iron oxygenase ferredoxin subunit n=1 Tax=Paraburkholderia sejongensis TaxID=2886946 RepID=A0ABS8JSN4_9BURK|nr:non-heme iron oxygenase ferredoxin subunit [Paraburkholderia sp. MMS20-SJTR3]MCC8392887.1 non-heme iron oxygenase ferredoxin subunit [Paraburkholderia sp. MMS20-SJTR3]